MAGRPSEIVQTGPSCELNSEPRTSSFVRVVIRGSSGQRDSVVLVDLSDARNLRSEAIANGKTREEVDAAFANCPCHDPANAHKDVGRTGCLALVELNRSEA